MATLTQGSWTAPVVHVAELPLTVVERRAGWFGADLGELWRYRELLLFLAWRDLKVRYRQTALGVLWAVLQPLATMTAFALFLQPLGGATETVPYALFVLAGLLPWLFIAGTVTAASQSVVSHQGLITKVYFPRLLVPLGAAGAPLADLLVSTLLLTMTLLVWDVTPGVSWLLMPLILMALAAAGLGVGTLLSALAVTYRDVRYVLPFLVQLGLFATPSIYLTSEASLSPVARGLAVLNPLNGLVAAFRQVLLGGPVNVGELATSGGLSLVVFLGGAWYFRGVERRFADVI